MNIHEYQAKQLFRDAGIAVAEGLAASSVSDAVTAWHQLGVDLVAVKSQIHAGGRGKGTLHDPESGELVLKGGVQLARSADEVRDLTAKMLGHELRTKQTGAEGKLVNTVYIEVGTSIARELYLGMLVDRERCWPVVMLSSEGGVDIEEVAATNPEAIHKIWIDPCVGLLGFQAAALAKAVGFSKQASHSFSRLLHTLWNVFQSKDCSMIEVNPLVVTSLDQVIALDAKVGFDDNAVFRHQDVQALRDLSEEEPTEIRAAEAGLSYITLDGNIGCLVNGAGLAMATMDIIKLYGGEPANFLDVGGGATEESVTTAFGIILEDPEVKGILVNIFGGIMRCDIIANGIVAATRRLGLEVPLVVRLAGTNVDQGKAILTESGLAIHPVDTMGDGAQRIVALVDGGEA